jgi:NADH dehydrogenase
MTVFLTGGTGFVGSYVLQALLRAGHDVRCLMRDPSDPLALPDPSSEPTGPSVERVRGDITDPSSFGDHLSGCDAVVHLVGIIEEHPGRGITFERIHVEGTRHVADKARQAGVDRFIHMSANGARPSGGTAYQTTKWEAEQIVQAAGFEHWTIFRPSILFGDPGPDNPEFASQLLDELIRPFPVWPIFGDGMYQIQPVAVEEVASAFVQAIQRPAASGRTYFAGGPDRIAYRHVLDIIARGAGLNPKPKVSVPMPLARLGVSTVGRTGLLPISPAQFNMLIEGNTGDNSAFYADFDLTPTRFTKEALAYLQNR